MWLTREEHCMQRNHHLPRLRAGTLLIGGTIRRTVWLGWREGQCGKRTEEEESSGCGRHFVESWNLKTSVSPEWNGKDSEWRRDVWTDVIKDYLAYWVRKVCKGTVVEAGRPARWPLQKSKQVMTGIWITVGLEWLVHRDWAVEGRAVRLGW